MTNSNEKLYIGVDVGGMTIKAGIVSSNGSIIKKQSIVTKKDESPEVIVKDIYDLCVSLTESANLSKNDILGIGFGFPGTVNPQKGIVTFAPNLTQFRNVPFSKMFKKLWNTNIAVNNDANCAAFGETKFGIAKGINNLLFITLGTGVGTGFIVEGKILEGVNGAGSEGGHICIKMNGKKCGCGEKGCWETYASATALMEQATEYAKKYPDSALGKALKHNIKIEGKIIFDSAKSGDEVALKVVRKYVNYVSTGIITLINIFRPEEVIIGGGVSNAGTYFTDMVNNKVKLHIYGRKFNKAPKIIPASLGNDAGILGAASPLL
ncbi:MAG: ROK family glucokinase [Clostridia bacterium]|nr:ROK family glucokinase [Clostridia bacterium]